MAYGVASTPEVEEIHPIDIVEHLAEHNEWDFDRVTDDQIAMAVEGQWRTYSITLAWSVHDTTLRLICTYEMDPPPERYPHLYEVLNGANDKCWAGAFSFWEQQKLMVWRYGLVMGGEQNPSPEQIETMIRAAVLSCERFFPAIQMVVWGDEAPEKALGIAMNEAYGRA